MLAIGDSIVALREGGSVAVEQGCSGRGPRELIGELLSPQVLAAGGGSGCYVTRC